MMDWTHVALTKGIAELQNEINILNLTIEENERKHQRETDEIVSQYQNQISALENALSDYTKIVENTLKHLYDDYQKLELKEETLRASDIKYSMEVMGYYCNTHLQTDAFSFEKLISSKNTSS